MKKGRGMGLRAVRLVGVLAVIAASVIGVTVGGGLTPALAATGANFVATGHDMDLHCSNGNTAECAYLKIVVDKVRNGSTLPILALDEGTQLPSALASAGETPVTTVNPSNAATFNATAFTSAAGAPLFSAIITASDASCGGCDNSPAGESNINARANDFKAFFNGGGGILALAGADNRATYYNFVPLPAITAVAVSPPFTASPTGTALGITDAMVNCCLTHNSFDVPPSPLVVLETDGSGKAETIAAFNASIGGGGFTAVTVSKTADASAATTGSQDGYTIMFANTGTVAAPMTSVVETLPTGFGYVPGSTTGAITTDPSVAGAQLTWTGSFTVGASAAFQFHFKVTVSGTPGHYTNSVSGLNGTTAVASATDVAPIDVATVLPIPALPVEGLPIAAVLGGGVLLLWWRRRHQPVA